VIAVVVGASGAAGTRVSAELARSEEAESLKLVGRNSSALEWLADALSDSGKQVDPVVVDVTNAEGAARAFAGADVVVCCAGPFHEIEVSAASAAIQAGVPYVSLCDEYGVFQEVRELDESARRAGVTVVSGCGLSPGISNFLVALAADELDTIEEIEIAQARSSAESEGAATARHFLYELGAGAPVIADSRPALERSGSAPKLVYFPEPVGWIETYRAGHPEVVALPERYGQLRALQFRVGLTERLTMDVVRAVTASGLTSSARFRRAFETFSRPIKPMLDRVPPRGPSWTALRVDVRGTKQTRPETVTLAVVDHLLNLAGLPLALAAILLGTRKVDKPGVHAPDAAFDARMMLQELSERGLRAARLEPQLL
jgi:saccharopine dehydrogenase (NAD+, L-lysine-forming)